MRLLYFALVSVVLCVLLGGTSTTTATYAREQYGLKWRVSVSPEDSNILVVTVELKDDGCRYRNVRFDAEYFDAKGKPLGTLTATYPNEKDPHNTLYAGRTYSRIYQINGPAASVRGGLMRFKVIRGVYPYGIRGMIKSS